MTPPTSITAAITSKIANASFYVTLFRSVQICVSLFTLMAGVFIHPELVMTPGIAQLGAAYLVWWRLSGITFSCRRFIPTPGCVDLAVRACSPPCRCLYCCSFNDIASDFISAGVIAVIGYWIVVRRKIVSGMAPPTTVVIEPGFAVAPISDVPLGRMS